MTYYFFPIYSVCANTSTSCLSAGMTLFVDFPSDSSISSVPFEVGTQAVYRLLITSLQELVNKLLPAVSFSFQYCMTDCEAAER